MCIYINIYTHIYIYIFPSEMSTCHELLRKTTADDLAQGVGKSQAFAPAGSRAACERSVHRSAGSGQQIRRPRQAVAAVEVCLPVSDLLTTHVRPTKPLRQVGRHNSITSLTKVDLRLAWQRTGPYTVRRKLIARNIMFTGSHYKHQIPRTMLVQ